MLYDYLIPEFTYTASSAEHILDEYIRPLQLSDKGSDRVHGWALWNMLFSVEKKLWQMQQYLIKHDLYDSGEVKNE